MLIILAAGLVIASFFMVYTKKNTESMLLLGLCVSLMLQIVGIMIYMAKKGGISVEVMRFFYFTNEIQQWMRYVYITLSQLGFMVAIGRILFPFFLLKISMRYSMIAFVRQTGWLGTAIVVIPVASLTLYTPGIYHFLVEKQDHMQLWLAQFCIAWIFLYLLLSFVLLAWEYRSISMKFCRRQFQHILIALFALMSLYWLYFRQDPGQIYRFYSSPFAWNRGIGYLQVNPSLFSYVTLVLISIVGCVIGFYSLFCFTSDNYLEAQNDEVIRRKFDTAKIGASMFVHSMKNQLLANKVVYKRIFQWFEEKNPPDADLNRLKEYIHSLETINSTMLTRVEELYRCVKQNAIVMVPTPVSELFEGAMQRFWEKYPGIDVRVDVAEGVIVLADKVHLCEAVYNLISNAKEAISTERFSKETDKPLISLHCHNERLYTVIEVKDRGMGMSKAVQSKVFDPFFSNKNSNYNWGMGLYYVREIVKSHLGIIRIESREGKGTSFFILLPRYQ